MPDFIRKISAKNVFIIIKTCSASGGKAPEPRFGGGFVPTLHTPGALPLVSAGGLPSPDPLITSPGFPVSPRIVWVIEEILTKEQGRNKDRTWSFCRMWIFVTVRFVVWGFVGVGFYCSGILSGSRKNQVWLSA